MKQFKTRDSATAALRKLGVKKENYKNFLAIDGPDVFVDLESATKSLVKIPAKAIKEAQERTNCKPGTLTEFMISLIKKGVDNQTILRLAAEKFSSFDPVAHKTYPAWFRCKLNKGEGRWKY